MQIAYLHNLTCKDMSIAIYQFKSTMVILCLDLYVFLGCYVFAYSAAVVIIIVINFM